MSNNKAEQGLIGLAAAPRQVAKLTTSAQIGFYLGPGQALGDFEALLYCSQGGDPEHMLEDLRNFFGLYSGHVSPKPGTTAARLVWFLLHERRYSNVGVHQGLKADIHFFYKISLSDGGLLEVFQIPLPLDVSPHPTQGVIVWAQKERDPHKWALEVQPSGWVRLNRVALNLPQV
jgi:hypothetical protein